MKICIITTAFPRWENDTRGVFVYECALALRKSGHSVRVIAMHNPNSRKHEWLEGIEVIRPPYLPEKLEILQKDSAGLPQVWKENPWSRLAILPFMLAHTFAVARYARDCDILHANWSLSAFSAMVTQVFHRRPYVVTVQGSDIFEAAQKPFIRDLTQIALKKAKKVLALSRALARATIDLGIPEAQVVIVPNGVDTARFFVADETPRDPVILYVGTLIERKGCSYLIEAFSKMAGQYPEHRLVLVGEGSQKEALQQLVAQKGLEDRVVFTGLLPQHQVRAWMQRAQVFVLPSVEEGQGVVVVEALACGTPCVGTKVGGIPDMVTPEVGRLVEPRDASALAVAIEEVICDPQKWASLSQQARKKASTDYDWLPIAGRILSIYQE